MNFRRKINQGLKALSYIDPSLRNKASLNAFKYNIIGLLFSEGK